MPIKGVSINRLLIAGATLLLAGGVLTACKGGEGVATAPAASSAATVAKPPSASASPSAPGGATKTAATEQQTTGMGEAAAAKRPAGGGQTAAQVGEATPSARDVAPSGPAGGRPAGGAASAQAAIAEQPRLFLMVTEPANESVSNEEQIAVAGKTTPDAVVSVDGHAIKVDAAGNFRTTVTLEDGANDIDIVASDSEGNEKYETLDVIYAP
ncbi:MAG: hypothetical protein HY677_06765 [Chloroflexi bacterium]|nr:hypothetical protein [Chloroflexota bacterium]